MDRGGGAASAAAAAAAGTAAPITGSGKAKTKTKAKPAVGLAAGKPATAPGAKKEYRSDETVEQFILRVCEEQVAQLHRLGEEQIELFLAEAQVMKASAVAKP